MEQHEQTSKLNSLPPLIQQDIKHLLVKGRFPDAKRLYEKWISIMEQKKILMKYHQRNSDNFSHMNA